MNVDDLTYLEMERADIQIIGFDDQQIEGSKDEWFIGKWTNMIIQDGVSIFDTQSFGQLPNSSNFLDFEHNEGMLILVSNMENSAFGYQLDDSINHWQISREKQTYYLLDGNHTDNFL